MGMSSPSSHTTGRSDSLPCSCQSPEGVVMKSPSRMTAFSPSTVVYAPSPSTTKRRAVWLWRWGGAVSPGRMSWSPA